MNLGRVTMVIFQCPISLWILFFFFFFNLMDFSECVENNILVIRLLCGKLYWAKSKCISGN